MKDQKKNFRKKIIEKLFFVGLFAIFGDLQIGDEAC